MLLLLLLAFIVKMGIAAEELFNKFIVEDNRGCANIGISTNGSDQYSMAISYFGNKWKISTGTFLR